MVKTSLILRLATGNKTDIERAEDIHGRRYSTYSLQCY